MLLRFTYLAETATGVQLFLSPPTMDRQGGPAVTPLA